MRGVEQLGSIFTFTTFLVPQKGSLSSVARFLSSALKRNRIPKPLLRMIMLLDQSIAVVLSKEGKLVEETARLPDLDAVGF